MREIQLKVDAERCAGSVPLKGMSFYRTKQCHRRAKVERDGHHYCGLHDPVAKKEKEDKRFAERRAQIDGRVRYAEREQKRAQLSEEAFTLLRVMLKHGVNAENIHRAQEIIDTLDALEK